MTTKTTGSGMTLTTTLGSSRYGNPEPRLVLEWGATAAHAAVMAEVCRVAGLIWRARPEGEGWLVNVPFSADNARRGTRATIRIELADGGESEAKSAMATPESVIREA